MALNEIAKLDAEIGDGPAMTDKATSLVDRLTRHALPESNELQDDLLEAAALIEQQAARIEALECEALEDIAFDVG